MGLESDRNQGQSHNNDRLASPPPPLRSVSLLTLAMTAAQLRLSHHPPLASMRRFPSIPPSTPSRSISFPSIPPIPPPFLSLPRASIGSGGAGAGGGRGIGGGGGGSGSGSSGGNEGDDDDDDDEPEPPSKASDPISKFLDGWRSRVSADPQFPFKVLMEELVGVTACVLGDMASRPNFGLGELDFVFSTLVVGSILNFVLMYLLAPTTAGATASLPGIFSSCPTSHMFEPGRYALAARLGTFAYKGATFAAVGFLAGLAGTAISNGLIAMRKKMDPGFETPNEVPPTLLNASTWALHMGMSSNLRYQTLNGMEFLMAAVLPPPVFKAAVVALRCGNNVLGGMSFVVLARLTGAQRAAAGEKKQVGLLAGEGSGDELPRQDE